MVSLHIPFEKLEKICAKNPTSILFARLADGLLKKGELKRATEVCRLGLRYRPSYVAGHVVMGKCHVAAARLEEGRQEFQKVLQLDADHPAALWHLGVLYLQMGWEDVALQHFERAFVQDPFNLDLAQRIAQLQHTRQEILPVETEDDDIFEGASDDALADDNAPFITDPLDFVDDSLVCENETTSDLPSFESLEPDHMASGVSKTDGVNADPIDSTLETAFADVAELESDDVVSDVTESESDPAESDSDDLASLVGAFDRPEPLVDSPPVNAVAPIATATLAELYAEQGMVRQAVAVLERVLSRDPENEKIKARLVELRSADASQEKG